MKGWALFAEIEIENMPFTEMNSIFDETHAVEDLLPSNLKDAWKAVMDRLNHIFPKNLQSLRHSIEDFEIGKHEQDSEHSTNKNGVENDSIKTDVIDNSDKNDTIHMNILHSILEYKAPLPGSAGALKPRRPLSSSSSSSLQSKERPRQYHHNHNNNNNNT